MERAVQGVGGSLKSFYFAFGRDDVYVTVDAPDNAAVMAIAAAVGSSGAIDDYETVVLLTPAEVDQAMGIAVDYVPPAPSHADRWLQESWLSPSVTGPAAP